MKKTESPKELSPPAKETDSSLLIRQFYLAFPIRDALRHELSWTHYRLIMKTENKQARAFNMDECIKSNWSTRQEYKF
jgi:hypothetical protein